MATPATATPVATKQNPLPSLGFGITSKVIHSSAPPPSFNDVKVVSKTSQEKPAAQQEKPVTEPEPISVAEMALVQQDNSFYADALAQQDYGDVDTFPVFMQDTDSDLQVPDEAIFADAAGHEMVDISAMQSQRFPEVKTTEVLPAPKSVSAPVSSSQVPPPSVPSYRPELTEPRMVFVSPMHKLPTRAKAPQPIVRYMEHIPKPKAIQLVAKAQPKAVAHEALKLTLSELRERVNGYMDELVQVPHTLI